MPSNIDTLGSSNIEQKIFVIGLALIGASLSLSLAVANILVALGFIYLLVKHTALITNQLNTPLIKYIFLTALLLQAIEVIHDGWFLAKASKVFITFFITLMLGHVLRQLNVRWLPYLFSGLILGLIIGTSLNQYLNPEYPLWATYSMTYANQAAGFVLTVGLLSIASKKWWVILPSLLAMAYYMYMTGERAAIPVLALSIIALLIVLRKYKLLLTLSFISVAALWFHSYESIQSQYSQNVRFDIWQHGLLIAQKDHFIGRGEHHEFNQEELNLYQSYATTNGKDYLKHVLPEHPDPFYKMSYHNQFIQFLVEYGLIGVGIFIVFLITPLIQAWKTHAIKHEQITFVILWTAFAGHCIFETSFDAHSAIILGLLAGFMKTRIPPNAK